MPKLYQSRAWLRKRFLVDKKSPEEIAKECNVRLVTIYRQLHKFELIKKR
ncbi:helix-turn-helix DNA binding domain protein [Streptomyces phage Muntaha]|uniref:Helix-turn-helix DNA binding domain protein n=1 Tax=Streptomyces phage Muntaha TaxID=2713269 RepID=A0A6G8R3U5_9CAUD|nr:helix-turn-helix DNA binding domain protein [Streptomyces phage Muntaha]QIN94628.1 helix-turn-helix DNA binding domain protein [Streptomyces phage Muntaha]